MAPGEAAPVGGGSRAWTQASGSAPRPCRRLRGGHREALAGRQMERRTQQEAQPQGPQPSRVWPGREGRAVLQHQASAFPPSRDVLLHPLPPRPTGTDSSSDAPPPGSWPWLALVAAPTPPAAPRAVPPGPVGTGRLAKSQPPSSPGWVCSRLRAPRAQTDLVGPRGPAHSLPREQDSSPQLCLWEEP